MSDFQISSSGFLLNSLNSDGSRLHPEPFPTYEAAIATGLIRKEEGWQHVMIINLQTGESERLNGHFDPLRLKDPLSKKKQEADLFSLLEREPIHYMLEMAHCHVLHSKIKNGGCQFHYFALFTSTTRIPISGLFMGLIISILVSGK